MGSITRYEKRAPSVSTVNATFTSKEGRGGAGKALDKNDTIDSGAELASIQRMACIERKAEAKSGQRGPSSSPGTSQHAERKLADAHALLTNSYHHYHQ